MPCDPSSRAPPRIGVFDSGVGGLSVLPALRRAIPGAHWLYVADSAHAPYGERPDEEIAERVRAIARFLLDRGAQMLVLACNTATAAAVAVLRAEHPGVPIVGVEPGLKPAVAASRNGRVGVMATTGTLRSRRFRELVERHGGSAQVVPQACPGLADAIETGALDDPALAALVERHAAPLRDAGVDAVALGCTHYPFVARLIAQALGPDVQLIDTAEPVARRGSDLLRQAGVDVDAAPAAEVADVDRLELWTSGDPARLAAFASRWLGWDTMAKSLPV